MDKFSEDYKLGFAACKAEAIELTRIVTRGILREPARCSFENGADHILNALRKLDALHIEEVTHNPQNGWLIFVNRIQVGFVFGCPSGGMYALPTGTVQPLWFDGYEQAKAYLVTLATEPDDLPFE